MTINDFLNLLEHRFNKYPLRHKGLSWKPILERLVNDLKKVEILITMEETGGAPDVVGQNDEGRFVFFDCSDESPVGRRSLCFDEEALLSRKENKPIGSVLKVANDMNVRILTENEYKYLQTLGNFDLKTSSWIQTPHEIRKLGGALFADRRYNHVFVYHNGAQSYYAARGFRACVEV